MTADEILAACRDTIGKPLNKLQTRIGFPREKAAFDGPVMRLIAEALAKTGCTNLRASPHVVLTFEQTGALEKELGRTIINSGDTLFGMILTNTIDRGEHGEEMMLKWCSDHDGYVDIRPEED